MTGALFDPLTCEYGTSCSVRAIIMRTVGQVCAGRPGASLGVFYTWETGPNNYNQFIAIKDQTTGAIKKFDPPLSGKVCSYKR